MLRRISPDMFKQKNSRKSFLSLNLVGYINLNPKLYINFTRLNHKLGRTTVLILTLVKL